MKLLHFPSRFRPRYQALFYLEQWIALVIGIVCSGVSAWAGFADMSESPIVHHSWFSESSWAMMKDALTAAVAVIGIVLVRFAFYKPSRKNPPPPVCIKSRQPEEDAESDSSASSTLAKPEAMLKRRG